MVDRKTKVLAISSGGGHWVQLLRLRPAFVEDCDVVFATVHRGYEVDLDGDELVVVPDANRSSIIKVLRSAFAILSLLMKLRPDVVISTGAAPGYLAIRLGKLLGARTIWLDSVANAEELSMSGAKAGGCADLWLTQWEHLSKEGGPRFFGRVF